MNQMVINMRLDAGNGHARIVVRLKKVDYLIESIKVLGVIEYDISSSLSSKQKLRDMKRLLSIGIDCEPRWLKEDTRISNFSGRKSLKTGIDICTLWSLLGSPSMK